MNDSKTDLPNINQEHLDVPELNKLQAEPQTHKPRILLLYGSLRERSYSRLVIEECVRLLEALGAEPRVFDPAVCRSRTPRMKAIPRLPNFGS